MKRWVAVLGVMAVAVLALSTCGGPGPTPRPRELTGIETPALNTFYDRDDYDATINSGEASLNLASHHSLVWSHIDRRGGSTTGYDGCDANGYCWRGLLSNSKDGLDDYIESVIAQTIALPGGQTVVRPIILTLPLFWAQDPSDTPPNPRCAVYIPPQAEARAPTHTVTNRFGTQSYMPAFDDPDLASEYVSFLQAAMAHISAQWWAQYVVGFYIATGYNTETILWDANYCGLDSGHTATGLYDEDFDLFVRTVLKGWHTAMTTTGMERPAYLLFAGTFPYHNNCIWVEATPNAYPTASASYWSGIINWSPRFIGLGFNGMLPDASKHAGDSWSPTIHGGTPYPNAGCDAFDMLDKYYTTVS